MLRVWRASGEELVATRFEDFTDVRSLKRHLHGLCGVPRFRQRLVCAGGEILEDDVPLESPIDLQLLVGVFS